MTLFLLALLLPAGVICLCHCAMYVGLTIARLRERRIRLGVSSTESGIVAGGGRCAGKVSTTVVVPARNEAVLLPRLLDSLEAQSDDAFQIVLVDDRSSDDTGLIMDRFAERHSGRVRVVHNREKPAIANHKLNALIVGVDLVNTDCILFTDADCTVPERWVVEMSGSFRDERIGLVLGPIETLAGRKLLSRFHSFDHVFKYSYTAACTGIDQATGGFGNNLALRRSALDEIGGLRSIAVSVTEDAALVAGLREQTRWKIRARFDRAITVRTEPQPDLRSLTAQEVRWHTGGLFAPDPVSRFSYRFIMFYLTASVLALPVCLFLPVLLVLPAVSFVTMAGMAVLSGVYTRQPLVGYWALLAPFVLVSMVYNSFLTITAMSRPTLVWKGEVLPRR